MLNSLFLQSCFFKFPSFSNLHSIASAFPPYDSSWKKRIQICIDDFTSRSQLSRYNDISKLGTTSQLTVHFNVLSL